MAKRRAIPIVPVTPRERQVLELQAAGKTARETADELGIAPGTVETHRLRVRRRLDPAELTERARHVVSCLALAMTTDQVAAHLGISPSTARNHRTGAMIALRQGSVVALTHYAIVNGWVEAGDALSPARKRAALDRIGGSGQGRDPKTNGAAEARRALARIAPAD